MSNSCSYGCGKTTWTCLGDSPECTTKIRPLPIVRPEPADENRQFREDVRMICWCCEHQFLCKKCYDAAEVALKTLLDTKWSNPDSLFDYWHSKFGDEHSVRDIVNGISDMSRMLQNLMSGKPDPRIVTINPSEKK